jgi:hypothetical protein
MPKSRAAEERLADLRSHIAEAFDNAQIDRIAELLGDNVDLHDVDVAELSDSGVPGYRTQLEDVIRVIRHEGILRRDREDTGCRLGLLCFAHLVLASLASVHGLLTPELIDAAVRAGYRDVTWGLAAAHRLTDPQEKLDALLALIPRLPAGPQRLRIYDNILKQQLPGMAVRAEQYEATEQLIEAVPRELLPELLPELRRLTDGFTHDHVGGRPRALAIIASRWGESGRSQIIAEALEIARGQPNTWGHAMTVLTVLPLVPQAERKARWREFVDAVAESLRSHDNRQFEDLTRLADVDGVRTRFLTSLIIRATRTEQHETGRLIPEQRDRLLGDYAERLAARGRIIEAFQVVRAIPSDQGRLAAIWRVFQAMDRWLMFAALVLPKPAKSRWQLPGRLVLAGLYRTGPGGRRRLCRRLLSQAMALDGEERTVMLGGLLPHLPGDLVEGVRAELSQTLAGTATADRQQRRQVINGLADLTWISPDPEREALLSRAFELTVVDDDDERRALAARIHWLLRQEQRPPGRATLLEALDQAAGNRTEPALDFARLPDELIPLAWDTPWAREPRRFRQFGLLAGRMAGLAPPDVVYGRLEALIASLDPDDLAGLLGCLPASLITTRLSRCLVDRWEQADPDDTTGLAEEAYAKGLGALTRTASQLPDDVVRTIVEWDRSARPRWHWTGYSSEEIAACLAPLYAQAGHLDEAQAMAAEIAAHHEKARALAGMARYLPDQERLAAAREALVLARSTGSERVQTAYMQRFAEGLMRLAGATRFEDIVQDAPEARALATIAPLFPPDEAPGIWQQAIEAMSESEVLEFITAMPDNIARDTIELIGRRAVIDYSGDQALVIGEIFARIAEKSPAAQFERLIEFMTEAAYQGRPVLLRQLGVIAPLLLELGGAAALSGLRQAIYRVATWWP